MKPLHSHPCYSEALTFIASRLLTLNRIYYPWLCEFISEKYGMDQPALLISELTEAEAVGLCNQMVVVINKRSLRSHCKKARETNLAC